MADWMLATVGCTRIPALLIMRAIAALCAVAVARSAYVRLNGCAWLGNEEVMGYGT
jgi:hypothetical protein